MHLPILHSHTLCWRYNDKDNHAINQILTKHNFHLCHRPVGNPSNPSSWRPVECLNDPIPTCFYFYLLWRLSTNGLLKLITDKLRFHEAVWHISIVFFFQCVWLSVCLKTLKTILYILFNFYYFIFFPEFAELVRISFLFLYLRFFYCKKKNTNFTNLHEINCVSANISVIWEFWFYNLGEICTQIHMYRYLSTSLVLLPSWSQ